MWIYFYRVNNSTEYTWQTQSRLFIAVSSVFGRAQSREGDRDARTKRIEAMLDGVTFRNHAYAARTLSLLSSVVNLFASVCMVRGQNQVAAVSCENVSFFCAFKVCNCFRASHSSVHNPLHI